VAVLTAPPPEADFTSKKGWVRVDCDLSMWIPCPGEFPPGMDRDSWAAESARLRWEDAALPRSQAAVDALAAMLRLIHEDSYRTVPCHQIWIYLPVPTVLPLPVYIGIWQMTGEREEQLRALTGANDRRVSRPPFTHDFDTARYGSAVRTLRYRKMDDGTLYGILCYALRSVEYETDVQVWASTQNLPQLQNSIRDIELLVHGITVISQEELIR
jgi:hypothetical protein